MYITVLVSRNQHQNFWLQINKSWGLFREGEWQAYKIRPVLFFSVLCFSGGNKNFIQKKGESLFDKIKTRV